jgi:hypothetical protein
MVLPDISVPNLKLRCITAVMLSICIVVLNHSYVAAAGMASLSFSPATSAVEAGKNLVVSVHLTTAGEAVNAVQADVTYPLNLFDPAKSKAKCANPFPTAAQQIANATINTDGTTKGMVKLACAVAVGNGVGATPFRGDANIGTITLRVRQNAPSVHNSKMLEYKTADNLSGVKYSGVARASDSSNILGDTTAADVTIISKSHTYSPADINNDNEINTKDLSILIGNFGSNKSSANNAKADINNDNKIDVIDFSLLLSNQ